MTGAIRWRGGVPLLALAALFALQPVACSGAGTPATASPSPTVEATPTPPAPSEAELRELVMEELGIEEDAEEGIADVLVLALDVPEGWAPLWAVATHGPAREGQAHLLALYEARSGQWAEVARLPIEDAVRLGQDGVRQVELVPGRVWLALRGEDGEGTPLYRLLSFDGHELWPEAAGHALDRVADLDGDGVREVVLDVSDTRVLCAACGVVDTRLDVYRWDGVGLTRVELERLAESEPGPLRAAVDRAVTLAEAGLWQDAAAAAEAARDIDGDHETARWNALLIGLLAEWRSEAVERSAFPLLAQVFAGEHEGAVDLLRGYSPAALFGRGGPLTAGTSVEGHEEAVAKLLVEHAGRAVRAQRDLAPAYFLRGLGHFLLDPTDPVTARADVRQALGLRPYDEFYAACVKFLEAIDAPAPSR